MGSGKGQSKRVKAVAAVAKPTKLKGVEQVINAALPDHREYELIYDRIIITSVDKKKDGNFLNNDNYWEHEITFPRSEYWLKVVNVAQKDSRLFALETKASDDPYYNRTRQELLSAKEFVNKITELMNLVHPNHSTASLYKEIKIGGKNSPYRHRLEWNNQTQEIELNLIGARRDDPMKRLLTMNVNEAKNIIAFLDKDNLKAYEKRAYWETYGREQEEAARIEEERLAMEARIEADKRRRLKASASRHINF